MGRGCWAASCGQRPASEYETAEVATTTVVAAAVADVQIAAATALPPTPVVAPSVPTGRKLVGNRGALEAVSEPV